MKWKHIPVSTNAHTYLMAKTLAGWMCRWTPANLGEYWGTIELKSFIFRTGKSSMRLIGYGTVVHRYYQININLTEVECLELLQTSEGKYESRRFFIKIWAPASTYSPWYLKLFMKQDIFDNWSLMRLNV